MEYPDKNWKLNEQLNETLNTVHSDGRQNTDKTWIFVRKAIYSAAVLTMLYQYHFRWLGHLHRRMDRIPTDITYCVLDFGRWPTGYLTLWFKELWKRELKLIAIIPNTLESLTNDRIAWKLCWSISQFPPRIQKL